MPAGIATLAQGQEQLAVAAEDDARTEVQVRLRKSGIWRKITRTSSSWRRRRILRPGVALRQRRAIAARRAVRRSSSRSSWFAGEPRDPAPHRAGRPGPPTCTAGSPSTGAEIFPSGADDAQAPGLLGDQDATIRQQLDAPRRIVRPGSHHLHVDRQRRCECLARVSGPRKPAGNRCRCASRVSSGAVSGERLRGRCASVTAGGSPRRAPAARTRSQRQADCNAGQATVADGNIFVYHCPILLTSSRFARTMLLRAEIRTQRRRNVDRPVRVLSVLQHRHQRAARPRRPNRSAYARARACRWPDCASAPACAAPGKPRSCCRKKSRGSAAGPAARPRCRRSWSWPTPMSPAHSATTRYGSSSRCSTASAWEVSSSCAACGILRAPRSARFRPCRTGAGGSCRACPCRTSRLRSGSTAYARRASAAARVASRICSRTRLVTGTSAVGIR